MDFRLAAHFYNHYICINKSKNCYKLVVRHPPPYVSRILLLIYMVNLIAEPYFSSPYIL